MGTNMNEILLEGDHSLILERGPKRDPKWGKIAWAALQRFPEVQRGSTISKQEIKNRLGQIKEAGYPVKPYSNLSKEQAWKYLTTIRQDVGMIAIPYASEALRKIRKHNQDLKEANFNIQ